MHKLHKVYSNNEVYNIQEIRGVGGTLREKNKKDKQQRSFATFCATIWYLSNASLVVSEGSEMPVPRRSAVTGEGNCCEEAPDSLQKIRSTYQ
jgi:hypothetical protein